MLTTYGLPLITGLVAFLAFDFVYSLYRNAADAQQLARAMQQLEHDYGALHRRFAALPQVDGCVSLGLTVVYDTPVSVILDTFAPQPDTVAGQKLPTAQRYRLYLTSAEGVMRPLWIRLAPDGRGSVTFIFRGRLWDLMVDAFGSTIAHPSRLALLLRAPQLERHNPFIHRADEVLRRFDYSQPKAVSQARRQIAHAIHPDRAADRQEHRDRTAALAWANNQLDTLGTRSLA